MRDDTARAPLCDRCFARALPDEELAGYQADGYGYDRAAARQRALDRARRVRFRGEWACPRCSRLRVDEKQVVPLEAALPNRAARRHDDKAFLRAVSKERDEKRRKAAKAARSRIGREETTGVTLHPERLEQPERRS